MTVLGARRSIPPVPAELLPIRERSRHLEALRCGFGVAVVAACGLWPGLSAVPLTQVGLVTAIYITISIVPLVVRVRRLRSTVLTLMQGSLLLDGIYVAAAVAATGGAASPLRFLMVVHVIAVILLGSYRSGLKLAIWHTLLFLLAIGALDAGLLGDLASPEAVSGRSVTLTVVGLWLLTLGTAAFSAASERDLRRQKVDLERLADMVRRVEAAPRAEEIPRILLDELCRTFGFVRGAVVGSPRGELHVLAATNPSPAPPTDGPDDAVARSWSERSAILVRELDPTTNPLLAALLPEARNVVIVPLLGDRGHRLGAFAVERGGSSIGMSRWMVAMITQFGTLTALALHNAWLMEDTRTQLETIEELDRRLRAHNEVLEEKVAERTEELRDVIQDLEAIDGQRRRLLAHVVQVAEEERRRIANDIHDDPVQKMVSLKMRLEMLAKAHPDLPGIQETHEAVISTIVSMRHLLFDLRPPILDEEGLGAAIRYCLENAETPYRWSIHDDLAQEPSTQTRLVLYRIAQEAFANARKHSRAEHLRVRLQDRDDGVWMEIEDDGVGFKPHDAVVAAPGHLGLAAMRERAEMAGGWCLLRSLPQAGTTLEVWMPRGETELPAGGTGSEDEELADVLALRAHRIA